MAKATIALAWSVVALRPSQLGYLAHLAFRPMTRNRGAPMVSRGGGGRPIVAAASSEVPMGWQLKHEGAAGNEHEGKMRLGDHRRGRSTVAQVNGRKPAMPAHASRRGARLMGQRAAQCRLPAQVDGSGVVWGQRGAVNIEVPAATQRRSLTVRAETGGGWCRLARRGEA
jgi:hypothetical protein